MRRLILLGALLVLLVPTSAQAQETVKVTDLTGTFSGTTTSGLLHLAGNTRGVLILWLRGGGTHDTRMTLVVPDPVGGADRSIDQFNPAASGANQAHCLWWWPGDVSPGLATAVGSGGASKVCDAALNVLEWAVFRSFKLALSDSGLMASAVNTVYLVPLQ